MNTHKKSAADLTKEATDARAMERLTRSTTVQYTDDERAAYVQLEYARLRSTRVDAYELLPESMDAAWLSLFVESWKDVDASLRCSQAYSFKSVWGNDLARETLRDAAILTFDTDSPLAETLRLLLQPSGLAELKPWDKQAKQRACRHLRRKMNERLQEWRDRQSHEVPYPAQVGTDGMPGDRFDVFDEIAPATEYRAWQQAQAQQEYEDCLSEKVSGALSRLDPGEARAVGLRYGTKDRAAMPWRELAKALRVREADAQGLVTRGLAKLSVDEKLQLREAQPKVALRSSFPRLTPHVVERDLACHTTTPNSEEFKAMWDAPTPHQLWGDGGWAAKRWPGTKWDDEAKTAFALVGVQPSPSN